MGFSPRLVNNLRRSERVFVITGAGISAESGVPTFRGAGGLWKNSSVMELATPEGFARDPKRVWEWYDHRRRELLTCSPNPAHHALAEIEEARTCLIATQNVDRLHHKAGSRNVVEIHGCIWEVRCTEEDTLWLDERVPMPDIPPRCECGALLRPAVVWFGEGLPMDRYEEIDTYSRSGNIDLTLVIGTSGLFPYIQTWAYNAKAGGSFLVEINLEETPISGMADEFIPARAGEILPALWSAANS